MSIKSAITSQDIGRILVLIECQNIAQAAEKLSINSSTLKRTIKIVEEILNTKLFTHSRSTIKLTKQAKVFYEKHSGVFNDYAHNFDTLEEIIKNNQQIIKIACQDEISNYFSKYYFDTIPNIYKVYFEAFSSLEIQKANPKTISTIYEDFDIIISGDPINLINDLNWKLSFSKEVNSCFYAHKNFIAKSKPITIDNIKDYNVLANKYVNGTQVSVFDSNKKAKHIDIFSYITSDSLLTNVSLIESELGITIIPEYLFNQLCSDNIIKILPSYFIKDSSVNIYSKSDLVSNKKNILQKLIMKIKQSV